MNIKTIASGSKGNCHVIEHKGAQLLIECGIPLRKIREALNFDLSLIAGCLISHKHQDHCKAARDILTLTPIPVYGPESVDGFAGPGFNWMPAGVFFKVGKEYKFIVRPAELSHDVECYGYEISCGDNQLVYLSDSGPIPEIKTPVTHLMIEANHSFRLLKESSHCAVTCQRIWETHIDIDSAVNFAKLHKDTLQEVHLLHLSDEHSDEELFSRQMSEAVGVPVYVAQAGV